MLRAHFYVISFTKNDLNMSIISTMFNNFECMLYKADQDIKNIKLISLSWLTTAYLDMVNVFSSHDFCSHRLFKVIKACCTYQRTRLSISWCLKSFFARCRLQFDAERQSDSLDRFSHAVFAKWSFLRLMFLQIPPLTVCWITELRSLASKTKVGSNRSQQRLVNRLQRIFSQWR